MPMRPGNKLLIIVAGAFALQLIAWGAWLYIAQKNKPEEIQVIRNAGAKK